ncbi:MAG: lipopolysaccharide biosynthesis protein [Sphingobacteriia bacterium]|nr:lipopolysaccharide biosynthesis protein [Sphingobacteriia bacterium]
MELKNYIKILLKHKYTLIGVPLIALMTTYFLTRKSSETYNSKARMATGLVDQSQQKIIDNQTEPQESQINLQFSNLIQMLQLKKVMDQVSYKLILHDLKDTPFHKPSRLLNDLNKDARNHAAEVFTKLYNERKPLDLSDPDQEGLRKVLISLKYDDESISKKLMAYRANNSDFIDLEFEADSPTYTAFVLNTLCTEFISYYTSVTKENQLKAVNFLDSLLKRKKENMDLLMQDLKNYKINNRVLNLNEQAKSLYAQIADFEAKKEAAEKDVIAYSGAIKSIDDKFNPQDRQYLESAIAKVNQEIVNTKEILKDLNEQYVLNNYDPKIRVRIDSAQAVLEKQINESADKYIVNPLATKENLVHQKIQLEVQLDIAKNSINSLRQQLVTLNKRFDMLVPHEAVIQAYEGAIDISSKEYIEILKKFNQTSMESSLSVQLKQVQQAMPGPPMPSKKMLLVIVSGVASFVLCLIALFVVFYLDDTLKTPKELANKTQLPVLGYLPMLKDTDIDQTTFSEPKKKEHILLKNLLNDLRFEVDIEMKGMRKMVISSLNNSQGKSFTAISLAYAYAAIKKKVLLIDGNFDNPSITQATEAINFLEDTISRQAIAIQHGEQFDVLGNKGNGNSLFELANKETVTEQINTISQPYDIVIIEAPALTKLNKAKEWMLMADKLFCVFEANCSVNNERAMNIEYLKHNFSFAGWILNKVTDNRLKKQKK